MFSGKDIAGDNNHVTFGNLRFWPENGLIHSEDLRTGDYRSFAVRTFLRRVEGLIEMLGNSTQRDMYSEDQFDRHLREIHLRFFEGAQRIGRIAQEQGMPSDPSARADRKRRAKQTVVMPATYGGGM
jgi:hypothetical protein